MRIDRIVYVVPDAYAGLTASDRYSVARLIGRLTRIEDPGEPRKVFLLGPGRWGTLTPTLGVPVAFPEIESVAALCEIVAMGESIVPDVSLGTHFFNDIVETGMLYLAIEPGKGEDFFNDSLLAEAPNRLADRLPDEARWSNAVRVIEASDLPGGAVYLNTDTPKQRALCYVAAPRE
jgi:pyruvate,water dikinase